MMTASASTHPLDPATSLQQHAGSATAPAAEDCEQDGLAAAAASDEHVKESSSSDISDAATKLAAQESLAGSAGPQTPASLSASAAAYESSCRHVTLKLECDTAAGETRWLVGTLQIAIGLGFLLLVTQIVLKGALDDSEWFRNREFAVLNVVLASLCLVAMIATLVVYLQHVWLARNQIWSKRRARLSASHFALLVIQMVNVTFWLAPNAHLLRSQCAWYGYFTDTCGLIRWTCWNTIFCLMSMLAHCSCPLVPPSRKRRWWRPFRRVHRHEQQGHSQEHAGDTAAELETDLEQATVKAPETIAGSDSLTILDASGAAFLYYHFSSGLLWLSLQSILIWERALVVQQSPGATDPNCDILVTACYKSATNPVMRFATRILFGILGMYALLIAYYLVKTFRALQRSAYAPYRVGNMIARIQRQTMSIIIWFLYISTLHLWLVQDEKCSSYLQTWFGLAPNQMVYTSLVIVMAIFFMPLRAADLGPLRKVLLQEVAWNEVSRENKRQARLRAMSQHEGIGSLEHEPLFCAETALKAFHWTFLSYRYEESAGADAQAASSLGDPDALEGSVPLDPQLGPALELFDLKSISVMREATHDTKLLLASGPSAIVLSFRGTSSAAAAWADLQVLLSRHPRQPGAHGSRHLSKVHTGFLSAWTAGGFRERVLQRVRELLKECDKGTKPRILVTGHSLGGALSVLAAYDIQAEFDMQCQLEVYTFGSPRVGNATFAAECDRRVPESWHIINDRDTITQLGKFRVYKRSGQQVIFSPLGDIIVRPGPLESRLHFTSQWLGLLGEVLCDLVGDCWRAGKRLSHHWLSEYGSSLLTTLAVQFIPAKGIPGGAQGVVDMIVNSDSIRSILESGGFVLEEVLKDAGLELRADGQVVMSHAHAAMGPEKSEEALSKLYKLGARRWRGAQQKKPADCAVDVIAPFLKPVIKATQRMLRK